MSKQSAPIRSHKAEQGASLVEYGIILGLISVLGIGAVSQLGLTVGDTLGTSMSYVSAANSVSAGGFESMDDALAGTNCFTATEGNDSITSLEAGINCVYLLGGSDTFAPGGRGGFALYPGAGDDTVTILGSGVVLSYGSGNDTYTPNGAENVLNFSGFSMAHMSFATGALDPANAKNKGWLSYDVVTPDGTVRVEDGMTVTSGSKSGFDTVTFTDGSMTAEAVKQAVLNSQFTSGNDTIYGTQYKDTLTGTGGNDIVYLGDDDDVYTWTAGSDTVVAGKGADEIIFQGLNYADVTFDVYRRNVIAQSGATSITLDEQARYLPSSANALFSYFVFDDQTVDWATLAPRTISDQEINGVSVFEGTAFDDVMHPVDATDYVNPADGDDTIVYETGYFQIYGATSGYFLNRGNDTLDMSKYAQSEVTASLDGDDILIETPLGNVRLQNQALYAEGANPNLTIDQIEFSDGTWYESEIRTAAGL